MTPTACVLAADVAAIERATLDAVPPQQLETIGGWLLGLDHGTVGRAHSAVPLQHSVAEESKGADQGTLAAIVARYRAFGTRPVWRVPDVPALRPVQQALQAMGFEGGRPTCVQTGTAAAMCQPQPAADVVLATAPHDDWCAVFLGTGFDAVDGASRVEILRRAQHAVFAGIRVQGRMVAVGMGSYSQGWASVHGMRTAAGFRGQGLASRILDALGREALARRLPRVFLQVEEGNAGARSLYGQRGFAEAWTYRYWQ